jgi:hypothetical protein
LYLAPYKIILISISAGNAHLLQGSSTSMMDSRHFKKESFFKKQNKKQQQQKKARARCVGTCL